jgi:hypothetical protein
VSTLFNQHESHGKSPVLSDEVQESIKPFQRETNITEGSEFRDDAIRMKDQPLEEAPDKED